MKHTWLGLLLAALLLLGGCGHTEEPPPEPTSTPAPTAAPTPSPEPTPEIIESFPIDYEEVFLENDDCYGAVTALGRDQFGNWIFHLRLENRSREIQTWAFRYQSINGVTVEDLRCRLRIGESLEQSFRVFREALTELGSDKPVQWCASLRVTSVESQREPYAEQEIFLSPFGEELSVRYEYLPSPSDLVAMDNEYCTVYLTGLIDREELPGGGARGVTQLSFVAVNKTGEPLGLALSQPRMDGQRAEAPLHDSMGAFDTLLGYIPFEGTSAGQAKTLSFTLSLFDPEGEKDDVLGLVTADIELDLSRFFQ